VPAGRCRLTVTADQRRVDLVVPSATSVADLLVVLVQQVDPGRTRPGPWVLQRLGEEAFDPAGTPDSLGIRDGEVVHLCAVSDALPPAVIDDIVEGVSGAVQDRPDRWRPAMTRWLLLTLACLVQVTVLVELLASGRPEARVTTAGIATVALVVGGAVWSRVWHDRFMGGCLAVAAVLFAAAGGLFVPALSSTASIGWPMLDGSAVLSAGLCAMAAGALGLTATGTARPVLLALIVAGGFAAGSGAVVTTAGLSGEHVAAVSAALAFLCGSLAPRLAAQLAGLRPPPIPDHPDQLQQSIDPHLEWVVAVRTATADQYLSALLVAAGGVCVVAAAEVTVDPGWPARTLLAALGTASLLRSRVLQGVWQRAATAAAGTLLLLLLARVVLADQGAVLQMAGLAVGGVLVVFANILPGRTLLPHWGRAADIAETVTAIAVVPLALLAADALSWLRGLVG
jgi:type VII secretion integral membrane protein EccD